MWCKICRTDYYSFLHVCEIAHSVPIESIELVRNENFLDLTEEDEQFLFDVGIKT